MLFVDGAQKTGVAERSLLRFKNTIAEIESRLSGTLKVQRLVDIVDDETGAVQSPILAHLAACVALEPRSSSSCPRCQCTWTRYWVNTTL
jgi:hypothetical protein